MSGTHGPGPFTAGSILTPDESLMLLRTEYPDAPLQKQSEPSSSSDSKPHDPVNHPKRHYTSHPSGGVHPDNGAHELQRRQRREVPVARKREEWTGRFA